MSIIDDIMRQRQQAQNDTKQEIPSRCHFCGSEQSKLYSAVTNDLWVEWRPIYKTELRRFLCIKCKNAYSPVTSLSLDSGKNTMLRSIPLYDESGVNLLTLTRQSQMEALPHWYPLHYLGQQEVLATWIKTEEIADAIVLKLVPDVDQEAYMNKFRVEPGFVYTSLKRHHKVPLLKLPTEVLFSTFFDTPNRERVRIEWVEKNEYRRWVF